MGGAAPCMRGMQARAAGQATPPLANIPCAPRAASERGQPSWPTLPRMAMAKAHLVQRPSVGWPGLWPQPGIRSLAAGPQASLRWGRGR